MMKKKPKVNHQTRVLQKKQNKNHKGPIIIYKNFKRDKKIVKNKAILKIRKIQLKIKKEKFFRKIFWKK